MKGRRYKLWRSGKRYCGVEVTAKEELCEKVLGVRMVSDSDDCRCF